MANKKDSGKKIFANPFNNLLIFVVVFAVIACISVGFSLAFASPNFGDNQNWVFFSFLVIFPFFALAIIAWLTLKHADKLAVSKDDDKLQWKVVSPEKQKRNLNREVKELATAMQLPSDQLDDLRSAYIVAEDLALRKIQQEANTPLFRYVKIGDVEFSAICINEDLVTCIQTTFVVAPEIQQKKIDIILKNITSVKSIITQIRKGSKLRLLLVLVTQIDAEGEAKLRSSLVSKFSGTPVDVDIRLLDFEVLQKIYFEN